MDNIPLLSLSIFGILLFAVTSMLLSHRDEKSRQIILKREQLYRHKAYQISILKEIQDRIGYFLDTEKVIEVITGSVHNLIPYSTNSYVLVRNNKLVIKTYVEESVSHRFVEQVKKSMVASINALLSNAPQDIDETISGSPLDDTNSQPLASYFHIPFVVNNKVEGIINISSAKINMYKEEEMVILYQIASQASNALSRLQEVLAVEKEKLISMIGSLADGVFMVDPNYNLLIINNAAKNLLHIEKKSPTFFDIVSSVSNKFDLVEKIATSLIQNKTVEKKEIEIADKIVQIHITSVQTSRKGQTKGIGTVVLLHDATTEKNLAKLKEDLTNMMVHELRAPLTVIKDSSGLLLSNTSIEKDEKDHFLNSIHTQSNILLTQIASILDAARIEAGKFAIEKTKGDIIQLIKEQGDMFVPRILKKHITLDYNITDNAPPISFDRLRISQVINNLLSNSLKFTPEGGKIVIKVEREKEKPELIKISVSDTGIGMSKDQQKYLFSKFSQAQTTPKEIAIKGSGLGLYITKAIVEAHGGSVGAESEEGKGTTIWFTLPI